MNIFSKAKTDRRIMKRLSKYAERAEDEIQVRLALVAKPALVADPRIDLRLHRYTR